MSTGKLTNSAIEAMRPKARPERRSDGGGLFIEARPDGAKYWRMAYRFNGKQKLLAVGVWPATTREIARKARDDARRLLAQGIDPGAEKQAKKAAANSDNTFAAVAAEWMAKAKLGNAKRPEWSPRYLDRVKFILANDLGPHIGRSPVSEIRTADVMRALRSVEARGALQTIPKVKGVAQAVMSYAVGHGLAENNPARDIRMDLFESRPVKHHAAITEPKAVGQLLRDIDAYKGFAVTRAALALAPLVMLRPCEIRGARWADIDLEGAEWQIEAGRMKKRRKHIVPLSTQAVAVLRQIHALTGRGTFVFPGVRSLAKPLSENTLNGALRAMGYDSDTMTAHGFRSMASTLLNEQGCWTPDAIERQLAHVDGNSIRATYNYAQHLAERRRMMQAWADYLDRLRSGADVVELGERRRAKADAAEAGA